jgi:hypothetical protein
LLPLASIGPVTGLSRDRLIRCNASSLSGAANDGEVAQVILRCIAEMAPTSWYESLNREGVFAATGHRNSPVEPMSRGRVAVSRRQRCNIDALQDADTCAKETLFANGGMNFIVAARVTAKNYFIKIILYLYYFVT